VAASVAKADDVVAAREPAPSHPPSKPPPAGHPQTPFPRSELLPLAAPRLLLLSNPVELDSALLPDQRWERSEPLSDTVRGGPPTKKLPLLEPLL
jgi:hypothetical protein